MSVSRAFCPASSNHNGPCSTGVLKRLLHFFFSIFITMHMAALHPSLKAMRWCTHAQASRLVSLHLPSFCSTHFNNSRESQRDANSCLLTWWIHVGMLICLKKKNQLALFSQFSLAGARSKRPVWQQKSVSCFAKAVWKGESTTICLSMLILRRLFGSVHPR